MYPSAQLNDRNKPKSSYFEHPCGSAPWMSAIHVAFAAKSVELLRECPTLTEPELIEEWNKDHAEEWNKDHANGLLHRLRNVGWPRTAAAIASLRSR